MPDTLMTLSIYLGVSIYLFIYLLDEKRAIMFAERVKKNSTLIGKKQINSDQIVGFYEDLVVYISQKAHVQYEAKIKVFMSNTTSNRLV